VLVVIRRGEEKAEACIGDRILGVSTINLITGITGARTEVLTVIAAIVAVAA
jgi:hypothetical protein